MKKRMFTLLLLASFSMILFAGEYTPEPVSKSTVTFSVRDKLTGEPLAGVLILIKETGSKLYTDLEGNCKIQDLKPGKYDISARYVSYNDFQGEEVVISPQLPENITIELIPSR